MTSEPEPRTLRVELELEVGADPIRGLLRNASGVETAFLGWLELIQMVDQARGVLTEHGGRAKP